MNVGSPRKDSKAASTNSPASSVAETSEDLTKFDKDALGQQEDVKLAPKTVAVAKDALAEPDQKPAAAAKGKKKKTWKKPDGMPKRPLSAYNIFFKEQRQDLLGEEVSSAFPVTDQTKRKHRRSHGKVGFQEMASIIGKKWKALSPTERKVYEDVAAIEKVKYKEKIEKWRSGEGESESMPEDDGGIDVSLRDDGPVLHARHAQQQAEALGLPFSQLGLAPRTSTTMPSTLSPGQSMGQHTFDCRGGFQYGASTMPMTNTPLGPAQGALSMMSTASGFSDSGRMISAAAGLDDSGRMMPGALGLSDSGRMMPSTLGFSGSGRMMQGRQGHLETDWMPLAPSGLQGDTEGDRLNNLKRMYELRVREAALLREEMQRSLAHFGGGMGGSMPGLPNQMGQLAGDVGTSGLLGMGQTNQPRLQPNVMGPRRASLGSSLGHSMRSIPQQEQQFPDDYYRFSSGGQHQLRQAEEAWQSQFALGNPGGLSQMPPQQQHMATDPVAELREQRARLVQQAWEDERADELQWYLRRQSGPGGGM